MTLLNDIFGACFPSLLIQCTRGGGRSIEKKIATGGHCGPSVALDVGSGMREQIFAKVTATALRQHQQILIHGDSLVGMGHISRSGDATGAS